MILSRYNSQFINKGRDAEERIKGREQGTRCATRGVRFAREGKSREQETAVSDFTDNRDLICTTHREPGEFVRNDGKIHGEDIPPLRVLRSSPFRPARVSLVCSFRRL